MVRKIIPLIENIVRISLQNHKAHMKEVIEKRIHHPHFYPLHTALTKHPHLIDAYLI